MTHEDKDLREAERVLCAGQWHRQAKGVRLHVLCQAAAVLRKTPPRSEQRVAWQALINLAMTDEGQNTPNTKKAIADMLTPDDIQRCKLGDVIDTDDWEPRS